MTNTPITPWPRHMDDLLAKSADRGGETLAEHTWQVLDKLAALYRLRPTIGMVAHAPTLWHSLYWTCFLHDFGKAARGFQKMLQTQVRWEHRHEILSLACFDWIATGLSDDERRGIVAAIASHHKDASTIAQSYEVVGRHEPLVPLLQELDRQTVSKLWEWTNQCAIPWIDVLGLTRAGVRPLAILPHDEAVERVMTQGVQRTRYWLRQYERWVHELRDYPLAPTQVHQVVLPILLRGLTTTADHMASAHLGTLAEPVREDWRSLAHRVVQGETAPYRHQIVSAQHAGRSALLVAPTGSGKTEAALYWALGDGSQPAPRIFYALPYQASMNAMFERLSDKGKGFGAEHVGLQHGRAMQALYARLMDQDMVRHTAQLEATWHKNLNTLHARPIKVFSPYQMLKAMFQLRGFEAMLTDFTQAAFIFDEIHAYEPARLALMLETARYLREHYGTRFFVMSATFPTIIRAKFFEALALSESDMILADDAVCQEFRRHRLHLLDGNLAEGGIERIVRDVREGKRVLVCVNTVRRAQDVRSALLARGLKEDEVLSIHSRYIVKHRIERERTIMQRCPFGASSPACALVATQVVEVSLNIDLDVIYTDPAPLEALLQRFGRVNRARKKGICPVYVFRQPDDGQFVYGRHRDKSQQGRIVRVTLDELARHDGDEIDETQTGAWLDAIYADELLRTEWEGEYQRAADGARRILGMLRPFDSDRTTQEQFEQMFDNIDVLPRAFEQEYVRCIQENDFLAASEYFVGISMQKYLQLRQKGYILPVVVEKDDRQHNKWMTTLPYSQEVGLSFVPSDAAPDFD